MMPEPTDSPAFSGTHAVPASPLGEPALLVDTERTVLNTCVLSDVTPGYSTDGRALISSSVLGDGDEDTGPAVRGRLAELYGTATAGWEHLATYTVRVALPAMSPPLPLSQQCRIEPRRYICGDHRATGSVQGALASGARAAREILASSA
jgi:hypothetical protein